jgi:hypothetical protein
MFAKKEEWLPSFPDSLVMKKMRKFGICFLFFDEPIITLNCVLGL